MKQGKVKWFNKKKGFGFIYSSKEDVLVHYSAIQMQGKKNLEKDQIVFYKAKETEKGLVAERVVIKHENFNK
jgi:CspA family cold shock protein